MYGLSKLQEVWQGRLPEKPPACVIRRGLAEWKAFSMHVNEGLTYAQVVERLGWNNASSTTARDYAIRSENQLLKHARGEVQYGFCEDCMRIEEHNAVEERIRARKEATSAK